VSWWRNNHRIRGYIETYELLAKYPWWSALCVGFVSFFARAVAMPLGFFDKGHHQPSRRMARTPEAFWEIVISSAVLALAVGVVFHLIRAHRRRKARSSGR
jgi:hypothetical protein